MHAGRQLAELEFLILSFLCQLLKTQRCADGEKSTYTKIAHSVVGEVRSSLQRIMSRGVNPSWTTVCVM